MAIDFDDSRLMHQTTDEFPSIGCGDIPTPRGTVHVHDGPGLMTVLVQHDDGLKSVGLLVYDPSGPPSMVQGLLAQMSSRNARMYADSLLRLAHEIDGGKVDS